MPESSRIDPSSRWHRFRDYVSRFWSFFNPKPFRMDRNPRARRVKGYISRIIISFVTGYDAVFTVVKALIQYIKVGLLLSAAGIAGTHIPAALLTALKGALAVTLLHLALPIIASGVLGSIIYIISAMKDEYDKNVEEDRKLAELELTKKEELKLTEYLQQELTRTLEYNKGVRPSLKVEDHVEEVPNIASLENGALLKYYLETYLKKLGLLDIPENRVDEVANLRRKNDRLPSQDSIEQLIKSVTGFDPSDELFTEKLATFLAQYPEIAVPKDFSNRLNHAFKFREPIRKPSEPITIVPPPKQKGGFRRFVGIIKSIIFSVARSNTAMGVIVWSGVVAGLISLGTPLALTVLVGIALFGLASGLASYYYKKHVEKAYRKNVNEIDSDLIKHQTRYDLLYKLNRLNAKEYQSAPVAMHSVNGEAIDALRPLNNNDFSDPFHELSSFLEKKAPEEVLVVPTAIARRIRAQQATQFILGMSIGMVVGIAIMSVLVGAFGALLPFLLPAIIIPVFGMSIGMSVGVPLLTVTIPGAILGGILSLRYGFQNRKTSYKAACEEARMSMAVDKRKETLEHRLKERLGQDSVETQIHQTSQKLLSNLIGDFIDYARQSDKQTSMQMLSPSEEQQRVAELYTKKERILRIIERSTGARRIREDGLPDNDDNEFYLKIARYLQQDTQMPPPNELVTNFKRVITGRQFEPSIITESKVKTPTTFTDVNRGFLKHVAPLLGVLGIGFPLGTMLFGAPFLLIPVGVVFVSVMTIYGITKYLDHKQAKNIEQLKQMDLKLTLIERSAKLRAKSGVSIEQGHSYTTLLTQDQVRPNLAQSETVISQPIVADFSGGPSVEAVDRTPPSENGKSTPKLARPNIAATSHYTGRSRGLSVFSDREVTSTIFPKARSPFVSEAVTGQGNNVVDEAPRLSDKKYNSAADFKNLIKQDVAKFTTDGANITRALSANPDYMKLMREEANLAKARSATELESGNADSESNQSPSQPQLIAVNAV